MNQQNFNGEYSFSKVKLGINFCAVFGYASAVFSFIMAANGRGWAIIFSVLFALFGVGVHILKSRICAVGLLVNHVVYAIMVLSGASWLDTTYEYSFFLRRHREQSSTVAFAVVSLIGGAILLGAITAVFKYHRLKAEGIDGEEYKEKTSFNFNLYQKNGKLYIDTKGGNREFDAYSDETYSRPRQAVPQNFPKDIFPEGYTMDEMPKYPQAGNSSQPDLTAPMAEYENSNPDIEGISFNGRR